jgi:AAA domain-containing protein
MREVDYDFGGENPEPPQPSANGAQPAFDVVTLEAFVAVDEPGADPLLGDDGNALIPEGGDVMFYGDGGTGKTTLAVDLAFSLATGDPWLGIPVARKLNVLLVENEGPRALFRAKLRRKRNGWAGSPIDGRLTVIEAPWARLTFDDPDCRQAFASVLERYAIDVAIVGPVTRSGMNDAGTLQEVRDFMALVAEVRRIAGRRVTFTLIHHEGRSGRVSGAWEGSGDTLIHVQGQGHGRTRVFIQKARWSSVHHATALHLVWSEGEGFELEERPEVTEETIADGIIEAVRALPGGSWSKIRDSNTVRGKTEVATKVRDRLLASGLLVNTAAREGYFNLWLPDDPAAGRSHVGTGQERLTWPSPEEGRPDVAVPRSRSIRNGEQNGTAEPGIDEQAPDPDELERLADRARELEEQTS